jgi:hypothetical protein
MLAAIAGAIGLVGAQAAMAATVRGVVVQKDSSTAVVVAKANGTLVRVRLPKKVGGVFGRRITVKGTPNDRGIVVARSASFGAKVAKVAIAGGIVGHDRTTEFVASGGAVVGIENAKPNATGATVSETVTVTDHLVATTSKASGSLKSVRLSGVVSGIGGTIVALRLPGGANVAVTSTGVDVSTLVVNNAVLMDVSVSGSGDAATFKLVRWAPLTGKDAFKTVRKAEVNGIITALSGQRLSVKPLAGTAVDFVVGPGVALGTIGKDDTVLVDAHKDGANTVADHVLLLAKAVPAVKPTVTFTAAPPATTTATTAVFDWSTNVPGEKSVCYLDTAQVECPKPPYNASSVKPGGHTFRVAVYNVKGWSDPADVNWTVTDPVTVQLLASPTTTTTATSATFEFKVSSNAKAMMCTFDGTPYALCNATLKPGTTDTWTKTYPSLGLAPHVFGLYVSNDTDLQAITPFTFTVVAPAPTVAISSSPTTGTSTSGAVVFTTTNSPTTVTCKVDAGTAAACTSPFNLSNLALGTHTVTVAVTNSGGTASAVTPSWAVTAPPAPIVTAGITTAPALNASGQTTATSASVSYTATNSPTSVTCKVDAGAAAACATSPFTLTGLTAGAHTVVVTATNATGTATATAAWAVIAAPTVTITSQPATPTTATTAAISFTVSDPLATTTCSLNGGAAAPCTSPYVNNAVPVQLNTLLVTATANGLSGSAPTVTWTVTLPAAGTPVVTASVTTTPALVGNQTTATSASIAFSATNGPNTFTCKVDAAAAAACTTPLSVPGPLAVGSHTVIISATNATPLTGTTTVAWSVAIVPVITISSSPTTGTSTTGSVVFAVTGSPTSVTCQLDAAAAAACTSPYNLTGLAAGSHTVTINASNGVGNATPKTATWTVQAPAPVVSLVSPPSGNRTTSSETISWTATNSPTTTTCSLDGAAASACTSPKALTGLGVGTHTFVVTASNGLTGSATATWTTVAAAPTVTLTSTPPATNAPATATFAWTTGGGAPTSTTCQLDASPATACTTGQTYSALSAGAHSFVVTVSNTGGPATASYSWTVAAGVAPPTLSLTQAPPATGTATTATIAWTTVGTVNTTTCTYDGAAYTPCTSPVNLSAVTVASHTFVVTATNTGGTATQTASWTVSAAGGGGTAPVNSALPAFTPSTWKPRSGTAGTTGGITNGTWTGTPTSYSYQWMRCTDGTTVASCSNIAGATTASYHAVAADIDLWLRAVVTATNAAGSTQAVSAASAKTLPS